MKFALKVGTWQMPLEKEKTFDGTVCLHNLGRTKEICEGVPVRSEEQVPVHKPASHKEPNQLQELANYWELVDAVDQAGRCPDGQEGCKCDGNCSGLLLGLIPLGLVGAQGHHNVSH